MKRLTLKQKELLGELIPHKVLKFRQDESGGRRNFYLESSPAKPINGRVASSLIDAGWLDIERDDNFGRQNFAYPNDRARQEFVG